MLHGYWETQKRFNSKKQNILLKNTKKNIFKSYAAKTVVAGWHSAMGLHTRLHTANFTSYDTNAWTMVCDLEDLRQIDRQRNSDYSKREMMITTTNINGRHFD